jgi:RNA polymerase sigma factor (sigma-70 family)
MDALVAAAGRGDERAWSELVGRYTPLVYSVINGYRLSWSDAADANQTVWLRLVEQLSRIREPQALPLWLITTTRHECLRLLRDSRRTHSVDPLDTTLNGSAAEPAAGPDLDEDIDGRLLAAERQQVLRDGLRQLPSRCQQLLALMVAEPPVSYEDISARIGIPVGSIGPTRARCLAKLRTCPAVAAFRDSDAARPPGGGSRDVAAVR